MNTKTTLRIALNDGKEISLDLPELCEKLGIQNNIQNLALRVSKNDLALEASVDPNEPGYPEIYLDGRDTNNVPIYMAGAALPNKDMPDSMRAILYAGHSRYEQDIPIAMVKHRVTDQSYIQSQIRNMRSGKAITKIVYVDTDIAQYRPWQTTKPENLLEHVEDIRP